MIVVGKIIAGEHGGACSGGVGGEIVDGVWRADRVS